MGVVVKFFAHALSSTPLYKFLDTPLMIASMDVYKRLIMSLLMPSFMLLPSGAERSTINLHFSSLFFFGIKLNRLQVLCFQFCELNNPIQL